jgi:hypothetical protein
MTMNEGKVSAGAKLATYLILSPFFFALSGWVLSVLWGWFLVREPFSLPAIGLVEAIGLSLIVGYLTHGFRPQSECVDQDAAFFQGLGYMVAKPILALVFGFVIKGFLS